jgi:hypothetical protein
MEEFDAEFALECLNLLRERRLRDAETHGGLSKMQFLRQNRHVFQATQFHYRPPWQPWRTNAALADHPFSDL